MREWERKGERGGTDNRNGWERRGGGTVREGDRVGEIIGILSHPLPPPLPRPTSPINHLRCLWTLSPIKRGRGTDRRDTQTHRGDRHKHKRDTQTNETDR